MKRLWLAVSAIALGLSAGAVTYDGKVLDGEWLINGSEDVIVNGTVSGTGDIRFQPASGTLTLNCENKAVGNLYIDWGVAYVSTAAAFGTGAIYINNGTGVRGRRLVLTQGMTIANAITLGNEYSASGAERLLANNAAVTLTGPLSVDNSKVCAKAGGSLAIAGGIGGNKVVLVTDSAGSSMEVKDKTMALSDSLWFGRSGNNANGAVTVSVQDNAVPAIYGFGGGTLKLGVDNPFSAPVSFAPQGGQQFNIDLNGHSIDLGSCANQGAQSGGSSTCTILNSSTASAIPTVSVQQVADNVGTDANGAALAVSGRMNFTKKGAGALMPKSFDIKDGTLRVEAGTFRVRVAGTPLRLANTVVVAGGTLDLNGGSFFCRRLEQRGGKIVNGKLTALDANALYAETEVTAEIVGKTVKPAGADLTFRGELTTGAPIPYTYELPAGVVFYMPFDTAETMYFDYGSCGANIRVGAGTPTFASAGKAGGCLYVDGASRLEASAVPTGFPVGANPVTVSCWIKPEDGCPTKGGWFSYGATDTGRGSSFSLNGNFSSMQWYANSVDVSASLTTPVNDGAWHHIVGVWDGTYRDIYVDGVRRAHVSGKPLNAGTSVFMIGKTMWDAAFKGWIDEVLVLNRAADEDEIVSLYANGIGRTEGEFSELTVEAGSLSGNLGPLAVAYPFNSSDTFLQDASKTGATLSNSGASFSSDSAFGTGGSASFDGSSFLSLATFPSAIPSGGAARTLLCFVKSSASQNTEAAFISYGNEGWDSGKYFNFAFRESGKKIGIFPWGFDNAKVAVKTADFANQWRAVAAIWDGSKFSLYVDGAQILAPIQPTVSIDTSAGGFKIGKAFYNGSSYFKGNLDEVAVCNRVLTQDELKAYSGSGIRALLDAEPLAANTSLKLEADATFSSPGIDQTIAGLGGTGVVTAKSLTLTDRLAGSTTVNGDLTLGDGIVVRAGDSPTIVSGTVTFAGGGMIVLPSDLPRSGSWTLLTASSFIGAEHLEDCVFQNLPRNTTAKLKIVDGTKLVLKWSKPGLFLVVK